MSEERQPDIPASSHAPHRSTEPHVGHGGTKYEGVDASLKLVGVSLAIIWATLIIVFALTIWIQKYLTRTTPLGDLPSPLAPARIIPPNPQLQVHPWEELPDVRANEERILNSYGKDAQGHLRIPIDRAMDVIVSRLTIRPDSPPGITTPGGEGRAFAGSVNAIPPAYRGPQIKGEIHKHAQ